MNKSKFSTLPRILMIVLALVMLMGMTGGLPAASTAKQSSYIVQASSTDLAAQLVEKYAGTITSRLSIIHAVAAILAEDAVPLLRLEKGITAITPNGAVNASDGDKNKQWQKEKDRDKDKKKDKIPSTEYPGVVGADVVWQDGNIGSGVTVAVLDTGLGDIQELTQTVKNKPGRIVAWKDFIDNSRKPQDPNGHGSHVAGIIANSDKGKDGNWNGIAPGVSLAGVRVLDETGAGTYESVISGLQWVLDNQDRYNIRVVNLSLVSPVQSPYWADPLDQAVTAAWANGLTVIVAAGNGGPGALSITVPGNNPYVVSVGAFTDNFTPSDWSDDYIAPFSSAGPTLDGFVKPDVVAPGAHMISVVPPNSYLASEYPDNQLQSNYFKLAGTSQATAVTSGIAALVISDNPDLSPDQVKQRILGSAYPWVDASGDKALYSMWQQGTGRVNAPGAVFAETNDAANVGMDIQADLAGTIHYEGFSYYDETTGTYRLQDPFSDWDGGYGTWDGKYGSWSGKYGSWSGKYGSWSGKYGSWSGKYGSWSGKYGSWSGKYGSWSGKYGSWSGKYGSWSGKYGSWSGGYTSWSGKYGSWSGAEPWAGSTIADPAFAANFAAGNGPDMSTSTASISYFLQDP